MRGLLIFSLRRGSESCGSAGCLIALLFYTNKALLVPVVTVLWYYKCKWYSSWPRHKTVGKYAAIRQYARRVWRGCSLQEEPVEWPPSLAASGTHSGLSPRSGVPEEGSRRRLAHEPCASRHPVDLGSHNNRYSSSVSDAYNTPNNHLAP